MQTTLNQISEWELCEDGTKELLKHLGKTSADDEPVSILTILDSNGVLEALWCVRAVDGFEREKRLLAVAFARRVQHLDPTGTAGKTVDVSERFAHGEATAEELTAARDAARDAGAAGATKAAAAAAGDVALAASRAAVAAAQAAGAAAGGAALAAQAQILRRYLTTGVISHEVECLTHDN